jgi:hypothetical protein
MKKPDFFDGLSIEEAPKESALLSLFLSPVSFQRKMKTSVRRALKRRRRITE